MKLFISSFSYVFLLIDITAITLKAAFERDHIYQGCQQFWPILWYIQVHLNKLECSGKVHLFR